MSFAFTDYQDNQKKKFYGKYRAKVTKNNDPEKQGRIKVECPSVLGDFESGWALPCFPAGGHAEHSFGWIPKIGALVWVEFEEGDSNRPIWVGTWWKPSDVPNEIYQNPPCTRFIIQTKHGKIVYDDTAGTLSLTGDMGLLLSSTTGNVRLSAPNGSVIMNGRTQSSSVN